jgi:adenylate cyclase
MDTADGDAVYRFEGFMLDVARGLLLNDNGKEIELRHKSFELLRLFVENAGTLLNRDQINQAIWPDVIVNDNGIAQCIRDIRLALHDGGQTNIRTVPRRGYIFTAKLDANADQPGSRSIDDAPPLPDRPSIAVLAFANMSGDPEQEYFSDGIADDIITELSRVRWLSVIARNSSFSYKGDHVDVKRIGRELGVRYVLEGSVRRGGERVRVNAQLIEAESANHLWAERYDRDLIDVFTVQDEITLAIATAIGPAVDTAEQRRALRKRPGDLGAWEAHQRGMWFLSRYRPEETPLARAFFVQALERDPTLAAAHRGLAVLYLIEGTIFASHPLLAALRLAEDEARQAIELDSGDANALAVRGFTAGCNGDFAASAAWLERALSINPSCFLAWRYKGWLAIVTGQPTKGRESILHGLRFDPRMVFNPALRSMIALSYYLERDYETAVAETTRLIADNPEFPRGYRQHAAALGQLGRIEEARAALDKAIETAPDSFRVIVERRPPWLGQDVHDHLLEGLRKAGWRETGGIPS